MPRSTVVMLIALTLLTGSALSAAVYRCNMDGKLSFSDKPCPEGEVGAEVKGVAAQTSTPSQPGSTPSANASVPQMDNTMTGEDAGATQALEDLRKRCASGDQSSCQLHGLNTRHYEENRQRNARCARGEERACDEIRCLAQNDAQACKRLN